MPGVLGLQGNGDGDNDVMDEPQPSADIPQRMGIEQFLRDSVARRDWVGSLAFGGRDFRGGLCNFGAGRISGV